MLLVSIFVLMLLFTINQILFNIKLSKVHDDIILLQHLQQQVLFTQKKMILEIRKENV